MNKVKMLAKLLGSEVSVTCVTYLGRKYVITQGTGETSWGWDGGGACAFAYRMCDIKVADLRVAPWDYSEWCGRVGALESCWGLARKLARSGVRIAIPGACEPMLSDVEFQRLKGDSP